METTKAIKLYELGYSEWRTYLAALLFVGGNIAMPQLLHLVPGGGVTWLPIYFFTLIGAYKYGWKVGLLTALISPLANQLLFGMPPAGVLPIIWVKSGLLAAAAGVAAHKFQKVSLPILAGVVLAYQVIGTPIEWAITGSWVAALQDFRIALPGMLLQLFGGYVFIKYLLRK
jgi:hypothetical protein